MALARWPARQGQQRKLSVHALSWGAEPGVSRLASPRVCPTTDCGLGDRGHLSIQGERQGGLLLAVTGRGQQFGLELRGKAPRTCDKGRLCVWAERRRRFGPRADRLADQGEELFLACWCTHAQQP